MDFIGSYLARIGYRGPARPSRRTLAELMSRHLHTVPFENLDIALGRPLSLERDALIEKIIGQGRGGFCYELNGLFAELLEELGFRLSRVSARVYSNGSPGPDRDHLALVVDVDGSQLLADVGFGEAFSEPMPLDGKEYDGHMVRKTDDGQVYEALQSGEWKPQYVFQLEPLRLADFEDMCHYHQTSGNSTFTRKVVCTKLIDGGRVTLSRNKLKTTRDGVISERDLTPESWTQALRREFGFDLPYPSSA